MRTEALYDSTTRWVTLLVSPYITWQGYLKDVPALYAKFFTITINPNT